MKLVMRVFEARNPKGLVPTLSEGEGKPPVCESAVCVEYIDELAGSRSLLPGSPAERAAIRLKVDWINKSRGKDKSNSVCSLDSP